MPRSLEGVADKKRVSVKTTWVLLVRGSSRQPQDDIFNQVVRGEENKSLNSPGLSDLHKSPARIALVTRELEAVKSHWPRLREGGKSVK